MKRLDLSTEQNGYYGILDDSSASSVQTEKIPFPIRQKDRGIVSLAIEATVPSGTATLNAYIYFYAAGLSKEKGSDVWIGPYKLSDVNGNTDLSVSATPKQFAFRVSDIDEWIQNNGIKFEFKRASGTGVKVLWQVLAR